MKKPTWILTLRYSRQPLDTPSPDSAEPVEHLSEHTLTDAELELVSGGGNAAAHGGVNDLV